MYPEEQMAEQPMQGSIGGNLRAANERIGKVARTGQPGIMQLTEAGLTALDQLKQTITRLEDRLEILCINYPEDTQPAEKMREPDMNRPDGRIQLMVEQTVKLIQRIDRLNSRINL